MGKTTLPDWFNKGWEHIWLPYTQMQTTALPLPVVGAEGCEVILEDGTRLIDGIASWWSACHGYQHPHIVNAMRQQVEQLSHVMFGGLAHEPAYRLSERLAGLAPGNLNRVFFSDSGSTAVEVALKMAVQYWSNQGEQHRSKFLCFRHAYHGDTMGAMSLADMETGMHRAFRHYTPKQYVVGVPRDEYDFAEFRELLEGIHHTIAGVIIEPLVQGAGGMKFHSPDVLAEIHRISKEYNLLFIADEIATGFGRTGMMFACEEAGIVPDILCVGKALTAGMTGLAATLATDAIFEGFLSDELSHALMHGPTYMANPLACAAANASLDIFEREPCLERVEAIETQLYEQLRPYKKLPGVKDVRVKGAIGVIQLEEATGEYVSTLRQECIKRGVWIRPFGDVFYVTPSFTITEEQLSTLTSVMGDVLKR